MLISKRGFAGTARTREFAACRFQGFIATSDSIIDLQGHLLLHKPFRGLETLGMRRNGQRPGEPLYFSEILTTRIGKPL